MPVLRDQAAIRSILSADPGWSVYALGDLAPGFFEHTLWVQPTDRAPALALLFRGFSTPVLFAFGEAQAFAGTLDEIGDEPSLYLHVRPEIVPVLAGRYRIVELKDMLRMALIILGVSLIASFLPVRGVMRMKIMDAIWG